MPPKSLSKRAKLALATALMLMPLAMGCAPRPKPLPPMPPKISPPPFLTVPPVRPSWRV